MSVVYGGSSLKPFKTATSNSANVTRYAFMSAMADCACASMLLGSISLHASPDKLTLLIIIYNIIAIGGQALFATSADRVTNRHTGVRMSVMILILGFVFPSKISITAKAVLMAVGNAGFHAYASSSLLSRSRFKAAEIGFFTAGGILGLGLAQYAQFFGYFAAAFLMIAATPSDKFESAPIVTDNKKIAPKKALIPLFVIILALCACVGNFSFMSIELTWCHGRKALMLYALAVAAGRFIGGFLFDKINFVLPLVSFCGGTALLILKADSKLFVLAAILLLSMNVPVLIAMMLRCLPGCPGLCYAIVSASAYLGYSLIKLFPDISANNLVLLQIASGVTIIAFVVAFKIRLFKSKKEADK